MADDKQLVTGGRREADDAEPSLRPKLLAEFIGQEQARANLKVFIVAAKARGDALDHVLFAGPPGLGKTTLAQIMARELGVGFRATSGPVISKAGDLAALLTNLEDRDVLFIDEIHRLNPAVEEILYPAMEDYQLDLIIGEGPAARSVRIDLARFTLIGATTRTGLLTTPLRDRFGIPVRLNFYTHAELQTIVERGAGVLKMPISADGAAEIARRSRGTPRIAGRLLRRVRDFASVEKAASVTAEVADRALQAARGRCRRASMRSTTAISPASPTTTAAGRWASRPCRPLCRSRATRLEEIVEPFLLQQGFIGRTPRGRVLTLRAYRHLGIAGPGAGDRRRSGCSTRSTPMRPAARRAQAEHIPLMYSRPTMKSR